MKKLTFNFLLIISLLNSGTSQAQQLSEKNLLDSIASIMDAKEIPGLFITVVSRDSVLLNTGVGLADIAAQKKVNDRTLFRIGSISKTFTALAILHLIEEEKLSLETPLREIAPEIDYKNKWEATHPVMIKHLLEHKAGFDDMHFNVLTANRKDNMTAWQEISTMTNSLESRWQPGLVHSYSNPGYAVLGYLIEKITKMPYQQYIHQEVLNKLGMYDTHFISEDKAYASLDYAKGYDGTQTITKDVSILGESAGSLLSNATDMGKFLQYFLNSQIQDSLQIIAPALVADMQNMHSWFELENNIIEGYGFGMYNRTYGTEDLSFKGHNGGIMGFVSDYIFSEELDLGIMISCNTERSNRKVINLLVDHFTQGIKPTAVSTKSIPVSTAWDGTYKLMNERNELFRIVNFPVRTMKIKATGDSLMTQYFGGEPIYYHPVSDRAFIRHGEFSPTLFLATVDGDPAVYDDEQVLRSTSNIGFFVLRVLLALAYFSTVVFLLTFLIKGLGSFFIVKWRKRLFFLLLNALPVSFFVLSVFLILSHSNLTDMIKLAEISTASLGVFFMSILGPVALIASIIIGLKDYWKDFATWQKIACSIAWSSTIFFVMYCFYFGWFAMALWSY